MYVTRHGNSCNNITDDLRNKKKDPSLSVSGVLSMMSYQPSHLVKNTTNVVHVSVCVRTWMTATLLYGRTCENLTLVISPFLKEKGTDPGNMPENPIIQKEKFINLLKFLKYLKQNGMIAENQFNCSITMMIHGRPFLRFDNKDAAFEPSDSAATLAYLRKLRMPSDSDQTLHEVGPFNSFEGRPIPQAFPDDSSLNSTVGNGVSVYTPEMTTFYKDGLLQFYAWYNIRKPVWPVFVVSHNHQMQYSLEQFLKKQDYLIYKTKTEKRLKPILGDLTDSNGWTIKFVRIMSTFRQQLLLPVKFIYGIKSPDNSVVEQNLEVLCSQDQSTTADPKALFEAVQGIIVWNVHLTRRHSKNEFRRVHFHDFTHMGLPIYGYSNRYFALF